jgi:alkylhydroperoxidase family enzyme
MSRLAQRPELRPARDHAADALAALETAYEAACLAVDASLADCLRRRVAESLGAVTPSPSEPAATKRERACYDFADQFVLYVPGVTDGQRDAVAAELGQERCLDLARLLYVFDMTDRLVLALGHLFEPSADDGDRGGGVLPRIEPEPLGAAVDGLHAAAMRLHALDPVTTELVRLHCARYHDCKT